MVESGKNRRNWHFRGGELPDEKNLVFKNITTKKIEKFVKDRIIKASGNRLREKDLEEMHLISVNIGENFIPFMIQIPDNLRIEDKSDERRRQQQADKSGKFAPWFTNEPDRSEKAMLNNAVYAVISAYLYDKPNVQYFTSLKGRKGGRILSGEDAEMFAYYSKPRLSPDKKSVLAMLDPAAIFGDYLQDLDNPKQKFIPLVDLERSKRISEYQWSFTIVRKVLKSKTGSSIEDGIDSLRPHRRSNDNRSDK